MKWRVDIEYEDGSFTEPRSIFFQAVYDGEPYHGYDTKKEALEAFCYGQVALDQLRKEREAEQKKEEEKIKEAKEVAKSYECFPRLKICGEQKPEVRIDVVRDFSPKEEAEQKKEEEKEPWRKQMMDFCKKTEQRAKELGVLEDEQKGKKYGDNFLPPEGYTNGKERKIMERLEALEEAIHKPYIPFSVREAKDIVYKYQAKVEALENRLTEIEGVLTSIGSPDYDLRKRVEDLEKRIETIFQNTRENHADMFERVCGLEKRLRNC